MNYVEQTDTKLQISIAHSREKLGIKLTEVTVHCPVNRGDKNPLL